jgi:hypothetical protein
LVNGVYAFGFLFMLPQLFVNYKLKSVAHLPWKAFMYKVILFELGISLQTLYLCKMYMMQAGRTVSTVCNFSASHFAD